MEVASGPKPPQTAPRLFRGSSEVGAFEGRGAEVWRGGRGILPKLFGGTSHRQAGMPYVLVRWYLCHPFLGSRLGSVLQVATHLCPILLATCWSCFNMALFSTNICLALKGSKSFPRKLQNKRYFLKCEKSLSSFPSPWWNASDGSLSFLSVLAKLRHLSRSFS